MTQSHGYAATEPRGRLIPFRFDRREPGPDDIVIAISYCGICHTDLHAVENAWGYHTFPLVPGHEIVGKVKSIGKNVKKFKLGDWAGVGTIIDSCRRCARCLENLEPHCVEGMTQTYGVPDRQGRMTYGGYSNDFVVNEHFALVLPEGLDPAGTAPLLCAGITTYSPLKRAQLRPGKKVGIVGVGGLGHVAVKFARAFGARVVVFTTSPNKAADALRLGAHEAVISADQTAMASHLGTLDYILDTVSGEHDLNRYINLLKFEGTLCLVGMPLTPLPIVPALLAMGRRVITGSMIGGMEETQEMLAFAAKHRIASDIELVRMDQVNEAFDRLRRNDVRYRFVIDLSTLEQPRG